ncbi:site-specific integrase [Pelagivirga sediminicola]|nr:site-specific integrase [Pelagivirga sediminicola]
MRHDELRVLIHKYFKKALSTQLDRLGAEGPVSELELAPYQTSQALAEASEEDFWDILQPDGTDAYLRQFCEASGIPQSEAIDNPARVLREYKLAYRDMLKAWEAHRLSLDTYEYTRAVDITELDEPVSRNGTIGTLQQAIDAYVQENKHIGTWRAATFAKKEASLGLLTEVLGSDRIMTSITKQDAQAVKRILLELPANRHKIAATRELSLHEAVEVEGVQKITPVTVDGYISVFQSFFDWAERNGYAAEKLFTGMRLGKSASKGAPKRKAFEQKALEAVFREITQNHIGLVKTDSHKWASLIGIFAGARLNEICQLQVADIQREDGIWFFNLMDEGDSNKRFKSDAAIRKVPLHKELLRLGLLDFHALRMQHGDKRMFPDYKHCIKNGYGRALGRWFNVTLTPALGIKSKHHVFHGLRHTMISRLAQAGIEEPIYQSIVGHERQGVTQQVYNRQGYTLAQLKAAIDLFAV